MRFFLFALFSIISISGLLSAGDTKRESTPNPALADFPAYWDATSWDTAKGTAFWTTKVPQKEKTTPSEEPISRTPQPNDFLDRQSEK